MSPAISVVTFAIEAGVAGAVYELWVLAFVGIGIGAAGDANYVPLFSSTVPITWTLAPWYGAQIRVKSGGTAGSAIIDVAAA